MTWHVPGSNTYQFGHGTRDDYGQDDKNQCTPCNGKDVFASGACDARIVKRHVHRGYQDKKLLKVEIHGEIKRPMEKVFWMKIKKVFKGDARKLKLMRNGYVILEMFDGCHVEHMKAGNKFVIFGDDQNGNIYTEKCYGNMRWEKTTIFHRRALATYYKRNCDCYPEPNYITTQKPCKSKYSFMRKRGTECKWVTSRYYRLCQKGLLNGTYVNDGVQSQSNIK